MALTIEKREREGILILALTGDLTIGPEDTQLRSVVQDCISAGKVNIILDWRQLGTIDSVGLGTLVLCQIRSRRAGGKLVLLNISRTHLDLLELTRLETVFEVFTDEQDALNSFFPDRAINHYDILEFVEEQDKVDSPNG